ncbi:MAG: RDD family protein [Thiotrichaceae bacterium]|nr:RDD family protein [Thiotrichaceae bacterium]
MSQRLDTSYTVDTPEGITLHLSPAGPAPRFLALIIDLMIRMMVSSIIFIVLIFAGETGVGLALILTFMLEWFYPVYYEVRKEGQTPGKKSFGLYVAQEDATPINFSSSVIRNLLRVVDFLPFFYIFGLVSMLLNRRFQRLGDLVAKTVVLHKPEVQVNIKISKKDDKFLNEIKELKRKVSLLEGKDISEVDLNEASIRPPFKFTLIEQQALISYHQRSQKISDERKEELAKITGDLVKNEKKPVAYLMGIANHLLGKGST